VGKRVSRTESHLESCRRSDIQIDADKFATGSQQILQSFVQRFRISPTTIINDNDVY